MSNNDGLPSFIAFIGGLMLGWLAGAIFLVLVLDGLHGADIQTAQEKCSHFGGLKIAEDPRGNNHMDIECNDGTKIRFPAKSD